MNFSKDFLNEATAAEINRAGAKELTKIRKEAKQDKKDKKDTGWYQKQQEENLERKRERLEWQKSRSKVKDELRKERESEKRGKGIFDPIRSIKTQTISDKDKDPTAYRKAIETGYDIAVGVGQAAINALRKKRDDKKKEEEKKDKPKSSTRPDENNSNDEPKPKPKSPPSPKVKGLLPSSKVKGLLPSSKVKGLLPSATVGQVARKSSEIKRKEIERRGGTVTPPKLNFNNSEFDKKRNSSTNTEEYSCWREEFLYELGDMRRKKKKSKSGEDYIVDVMPEKKTNTITMNPTIREKYLYERKRDHLANALLGLAFATNVAQSPSALIRSGHIEGPGIQLMSRMMQKRKEANRNLDSGRVSHPARNIKKTDKVEVKKREVKEDLDKKELVINIVKKLIDEKKRKNYLLNSGYIGEENIEEVAAWQRKEGKNPKGGLNKKGVASYRAQNPGSKLQTAVTTNPSKLKPGSKAANRRKSFCARMGGMRGPMKDEKGRPTRKALSLRKWNC